MKFLYLLLLAACHSAVVERPLPDDPLEARAALVFVECGPQAPAMPDPYQITPGPLDDYDAPWRAARSGMAVVLDDRRALTAAHVVRCPDVPTVELVTATGRAELMYVYRERGDLAWLELAAQFESLDAPTFDPLPYSPAVGDVACAALPYAGPRGERCGDVVDVDPDLLEFDAPGFSGESGAGVWDGAALLGVVSRRGERGTVAWRVRAGDL